MNRIAVIGHFGGGQDYFDGQTVKTRIVTKELKAQLGDGAVGTIDTHGGKLTALKAPFQVRKALKRSANVLILPAKNGLRIYVPLLRAFNRFFHRSLHYVVIGGWLPEFLKAHPSLIKGLRTFQGIYVETRAMKEALESLGLQNVFVVPNCKELSVLTEAELVPREAPPYPLCTFSRVMKEKGIETAISAVKTVNERLGKTVFTLDIYGQVDPHQQEWFDGLKVSFPDYVRYAGTVPYDQSVSVLKDYFLLLFPTFYEGEGFAGTLIDAMAAGLPVIASDWRYNAEIVREGETGYLHPAFEPEKLTDRLLWAVEHPDEVDRLRAACLARAADYQPTNALRELFDRLA